MPDGKKMIIPDFKDINLNPFRGTREFRTSSSFIRELFPTLIVSFIIFVITALLAIPIMTNGTFLFESNNAVDLIKILSISLLVGVISGAIIGLIIGISVYVSFKLLYLVRVKKGNVYVYFPVTFKLKNRNIIDFRIDHPSIIKSIMHDYLISGLPGKNIVWLKLDRFEDLPFILRISAKRKGWIGLDVDDPESLVLSIFSIRKTRKDIPIDSPIIENEFNGD